MINPQADINTPQHTSAEGSAPLAKHERALRSLHRLQGELDELEAFVAGLLGEQVPESVPTPGVSDLPLVSFLDTAEDRIQEEANRVADVRDRLRSVLFG